MWQGIFNLFLYVIVALSPLALALSVNAFTGAQFTRELAKSFGLIGFSILVLQFVLSARIKWITRPFGFDIVIRFHKYMAIFAGALILAHPLLLAAGSGWGLLYSPQMPWYISLGRLSLLALLISAVISIFQPRIRLGFEKWRLLHDILGPAVILFAFIHSYVVGSDLQNWPMRILWIIFLGSALLIFAYHRFYRPWILAKKPYKVVEVKQEADDVWTVTLAPPEGAGVFDYLPGQFQFLTFHRKRGLPEEEHHWTISSSPEKRGTVSSTIKKLGDFTATIGQTVPGDTASVDAPFGRFSYALHPDEKDLVFIAGGIGITPMMGMLRHMRDTGKDLPVLLLYANQKEDQIVFKKELDEIAAGEAPKLKVVYFVSKPSEKWQGEKGIIDSKKIEEYCGKELKNKAFYITGPKPMLEAVIKILRRLGVRDDRIHIELFSFID